jgi:hypothetical protein
MSQLPVLSALSQYSTSRSIYKHPFHVAQQREKSVSTKSSSKPFTSPLPGSNKKFTEPALD